MRFVQNDVYPQGSAAAVAPPALLDGAKGPVFQGFQHRLLHHRWTGENADVRNLALPREAQTGRDGSVAVHVGFIQSGRSDGLLRGDVRDQFLFRKANIVPLRAKEKIEQQGNSCTAGSAREAVRSGTNKEAEQMRNAYRPPGLTRACSAILSCRSVASQALVCTNYCA